MAFVVRIQHVSVPMPADGAERARAFYGDVLGMTEKTPPSSLSGVVWFESDPNGQELHCFTVSGFEMHDNLPQHLCLQVENLDAMRVHLTAKGVAIEETIPITNRPRFFVHDPFQNKIEITQVLGDYD